MISILDFLYKLNEMGLFLWLENGVIKYRQYKECDKLDEIISEIKAYKDDFINLLELNKIYKTPDPNERNILSSGGSYGKLSYAQERMRFIEAYSGGTNAYNIPTMMYKLDITKEWQQKILERTLIKIVQKHEVLRSLVKEDEDGIGYQLVKDLEEQELQIRKLIFISDEELQKQMEKDANHIYDLSTEYPIRIGIYTVTEAKECCYLSIVVHHIAFDGWSVEIFLRELKKYYTYYARKELGLEVEDEQDGDLKIQYKDFALWQKSFLQGKKLEKEIKYWKDKLLGYESLNFPTDRVRPKEIDYSGSRVFFEVGEEDSKKLRILAKELGVSLYSILLASYCLVLRGYTGQDDIVIGTPVSNRHYKQVTDLIGFFVNTLVLRIDIGNKKLIRDYIKYVGEEVVKAQLHQDLPFEKIVEELVKEKDRSRHPIFQVIFALENFAQGFIANNGGDSRERVPLESIDSIIEGYYVEEIYNISKFDLSLYIDDSKEKLGGNVEYATSLFDKSTINRFIEVYIHIIKQLAKLAGNKEKQCHREVAHINYLGKEEKDKIVYRWNEREKPYLTQGKTIVELIESQVERFQDRIALVYAGRYLTYGGLNKMANRLANYLVLQGIKTEILVAVSMERSFDVVVAILAIQKTGGAYLPLDLESPEDRAKYIVEDSKAKILITKREFASKFQKIDCEILCIDEFDYPKYDNENLDKRIIPTSLSYIIYTSGSTGLPKGVLCHHDGVLNTLISINERFSVNEEDTILALSNLTFDLSVYDILGILMAGGVVVIPEQLRIKDAEYWSYLVNKQGITIWNTVPQLAKLWSYHEEILSSERKRNRIRLFLLSGDSIQADLPESLKKLCSEDVIVMCLGGATEASIWSIWYTAGNELVITIPYGKPMPNQYIYVLDKTLNAVPIGTAGEIFISGIGLARGYLNRPELTSEKFIPNPFSKKIATERIYRTGDIGKFLADGNIAFIGRDDNQVKIRGNRVELGEIEAILFSIKEVKQVFVLVEDDSLGQKLLIAYVVLRSFVSNIEDLLKQACKEKLPDYMHPKHVVVLDEFPITPNGKIDKKELSKYHKVLPEITQYEEPRDGIEKILANIWSDLLGVNKISRKDNLFKLGGDSIVSIQMVSRAKKEGIFLEIKQIFNTPTLEDVARSAKIVHNNFKDQEEEAGVVQLLPIQKWFFDNYKEINHFNQAFWFISDQDIDLEKLEDTISQIRYSHDSFRLRFKKEGLEWIQYYQKDFSTVKLEIEGDVLSEQELTDRINIIHKKLDIINGPMDYVIWFNGYGLLWVIHHLIIDGVSWRILLDDLNMLYTNQKLPSKSHSYKVWSHYIHNYNNLNQTYKFYSKPNNGLLNKLKPNNENINEIFINFSQEVTTKFIKEAHKCYNTQANDLLLSALKLAIGDVIGNYDISVDLEGHGREDLESNIDLSRTIGWFTSIFPVNINISNPNNLSNTIIEIKEGLRQIPHKGLTYGVASMKRNVITKSSDILFNYLGQLSTNNKVSETFRFGDYITGNTVDSKNSIVYVLEINGAVKDNILSFGWKYKDYISYKTIDQIINRFKVRLTEIIEHCSNVKNYRYTISDFEADIDEKELSYIIDLI